MANITTDFGSVENHSFFAGTEVAALTTSVTLSSGQGILRKGAVVGKVTADGKYKLVDGTATDGSETASFVLAEEIDTTGADQKAVAYKRGVFRYDALYVAVGDTVAAHEEELRDASIYYKTDY